MSDPMDFTKLYPTDWIAIAFVVVVGALYMLALRWAAKGMPHV